MSCIQHVLRNARQVIPGLWARFWKWRVLLSSQIQRADCACCIFTMKICLISLGLNEVKYWVEVFSQDLSQLCACSSNPAQNRLVMVYFYFIFFQVNLGYICTLALFFISVPTLFSLIPLISSLRWPEMSVPRGIQDTFVLFVYVVAFEWVSAWLNDFLNYLNPTWISSS